MMDAIQFVDTFKYKPSNIYVQFATVDAAYNSGKPKLLFDGETAISTKGYEHLESFAPAGGERVMLINGVIIGKIKQY